MSDKVIPINHLRLASANDLPLMTQEQLTNMVVTLTEQVLTLQEDIIRFTQEQQQLLEWIKSIKQGDKK
jgi:hypothetical protein